MKTKINRKGKPVERRGRKTTGLKRAPVSQWQPGYRKNII